MNWLVICQFTVVVEVDVTMVLSHGYIHVLALVYRADYAFERAWETVHNYVQHQESGFRHVYHNVVEHAEGG